MASIKITLQRGFNDLFFKMIDETITMFQGDSDFLIAKTTFETLKRSNPGILIKGWILYILAPFKENKHEFTLAEFIDNFHLLTQNNRFPELTAFFTKLHKEITKLMYEKKDADMDKYKKIDNYFTNLNKLAITRENQGFP
jgi:hypothetical protein